MSSSTKKSSTRWGKKEDEVLLSMFQNKTIDATIIPMLGSENCYIDNFWNKYPFFNEHHSLPKFRDHVRRKAVMFLEEGTFGRKSTPTIINSQGLEEKRSKRWRTKCPQTVFERIERARTQKMYVVSRKPRMEIVDGCERMARCVFRVAGSTGNLYKVTIDKIPTCNCPHFEKNQDCCKHTLFVLLKVIGLDKDSELLYQKAFVTKELQHMFKMMEKKNTKHSSSDGMNDLVNRLKSTTLKSTVMHEEGGYKYNNISALTGQSLERDTSTYRPFHHERYSYRYGY